MIQHYALRPQQGSLLGTCSRPGYGVLSTVWHGRCADRLHRGARARVLEAQHQESGLMQRLETLWGVHKQYNQTACGAIAPALTPHPVPCAASGCGHSAAEKGLPLSQAARGYSFELGVMPDPDEQAAEAARSLRCALSGNQSAYVGVGARRYEELRSTPQAGQAPPEATQWCAAQGVGRRLAGHRGGPGRRVRQAWVWQARHGAAGRGSHPGSVQWRGRGGQSPHPDRTAPA